MQKKSVTSPAAPAAIGPYSPAIGFGNLLFVSGQIPLDPATGNIVGQNAAEQAERCLENLGALLKAGGSSFAQVLKTTIFLTDLADFVSVNEVYARYLPAPHPARSTIQISALPKGAKVEIEAIAAVG
jgi:2-iminobutanoate/2-iminopropanoate deaminase